MKRIFYSIFFTINFLSFNLSAASLPEPFGIKLGSIFEKNNIKILRLYEENNSTGEYLINPPNPDKYFDFYKVRYSKISGIIFSIYSIGDNKTTEECKIYHDFYSNQILTKYPNLLEIKKEALQNGFYRDVRYIYKDFDIYLSCAFRKLHIHFNLLSKSNL